MTMLSLSATADATGKATVEITPNKSGVQWTVAQIGVETIPVRPAGNATTRLNGRYVTSTAVLPSSAGGQPFINIQPIDKLSIDFVGLTAGDSCIVSVFYNESLWGETPRADVV